MPSTVVGQLRSFAPLGHLCTQKMGPANQMVTVIDEQGSHALTINCVCLWPMRFVLARAESEMNFDWPVNHW